MVNGKQHSVWFVPTGMKGLPQNVLLNFRLEFPKSDLTIYLPSGISEIFRQMVSTPNLQFVMTHASHVCSQHVVVCLCLFYFACFVVRYLCRSGCRKNYYLTPSLPRLPIYYFFFLLLPTILSLTQKISARLKLVSVPFSSLLFDIGQQLSFFYSRYF